MILVHYTGKETLKLPQGLPSAVHIIPGRPDIQDTVARVIMCEEEALPLPEDMVMASVRLKVKSALEAASAPPHAAASPLRRFDSVVTRLRSVGVTARQIASLLGGDENSLDERLDAGLLEHRLRLAGVSELVLTCGDIAKLVNELGTGDGPASWRELKTFLTAPISVEMLQRLCDLKTTPGLRETFHDWDYWDLGTGTSGFLTIKDLDAGLSAAGIQDETCRMLLIDIFMDHGKMFCTFESFAAAFDTLTARLRLYTSLATDRDRGASATWQSPARFVMAMSPQDLERWGILDCGGAASVAKALEKASEDFSVSFQAESFAW